MQGWTLPTTVTVGGKPYAVHTDYRDILDIIDHLQNTDDNEQERWYIAMALFYENWRDIPAQNRQEAAERDGGVYRLRQNAGQARSPNGKSTGSRMQS